MSRVIDQQTFERFLPLACDWSAKLEEFVLERGTALTGRPLEDARLAGVQDCSAIRVLVVDAIPMPDHPDLAEVAKRAQIITVASRGAAGSSWKER